MSIESSNDAKWSLRPATQDDLSLIQQIEKQCHPSPWTPEHFQAELKKPYCHFLVFTDDETDAQIAGYIVFWLMFDECQILNIVVDLKYRGLGFAKRMIAQAVNMALRKGIKKLILDVRKTNPPAIQLYQGLGFNIIHVRKGFYSNGEDAYQMALELNDDGLRF